jgi:hypothetical protein
MNTRRRICVFAVLALLLLGLSAATVLANPVLPCKVGTPGYWKNHPDAWPVEVITISNNGDKIEISKEEAILLMSQPDRGDKSLTLFRAYVAATLNRFSGCDITCEIPGTTWTVQDIIYQANFWLWNRPPGSDVRGNSDAWQDGGEWKYEWLDAYNNGELCVPPRD